MTVEPGVTPPSPTPTKPYKAVLAFIGTVLATTFAITKDRTDLDTLGASGWLTILVTSVLVAAGVYVVPNPGKSSVVRSKRRIV